MYKHHRLCKGNAFLLCNAILYTIYECTTLCFVQYGPMLDYHRLWTNACWIITDWATVIGQLTTDYPISSTHTLCLHPQSLPPCFLSVATTSFLLFHSNKRQFSIQSCYNQAPIVQHLLYQVTAWFSYTYNHLDVPLQP